MNANILLTPNPASDRVQIHLEDRDLALEEVRVYNISGKLVRNERAIDKHYHTIDRKALESGIYLLSLRLDNGKIASRQVVFD